MSAYYANLISKLCEAIRKRIKLRKGTFATAATTDCFRN